MTKLISLSTTSLLFAGAIVGLSLAACDLGPKKIGQETMGAPDECEEGESKPAEDGCNTCTCSDGGWACTELACEPDPGVCEEGESKPADDGCNTCSCLDGAWSCTKLSCEPSECEEGEQMMMDNCNQCACFEGKWACDLKYCAETETDSGGTGETEGDTGGDTEGNSGDPGVCGDGIVQGAEQCDDGNLVDDDACPNDCAVPENMCGPQDPLEVKGVVVESDALIVEVSYGGGCEEHTIGLCWNGAFAESFPVQVWVDLSHDAHDDNCDALITEPRKLDLSGLRTAYQEGYQTEHGTIVIHLDGWADAVDYTF